MPVAFGLISGRDRSAGDIVTMFLDELARRIRQGVAPKQLPDADTTLLFRLYAVIALAEGEKVEASDVHNAWSLGSATLSRTTRSDVSHCRRSRLSGAISAKFFGSAPTGCPNGATWAISAKLNGPTCAPAGLRALSLSRRRRFPGLLIDVFDSAGRSSQLGSGVGSSQAVLAQDVLPGLDDSLLCLRDWSRAGASSGSVTAVSSRCPRPCSEPLRRIGFPSPSNL